MYHFGALILILIFNDYSSGLVGVILYGVLLVFLLLSPLVSVF